VPPAARNPFEKGFLGLPKLFIKVFFIALFLRVPSRLLPHCKCLRG
jgi:hypothetical protein